MKPFSGFIIVLALLLTGCGGHNAVPRTSVPGRSALSSSTSSLDQLTYHVDNLRTGWNQNERSLTVSTVGSSSFALQQNIAVDGVVMAQPLYVSQFKLSGGTHNILIIATEHNSVYAFDADTAAQLWHVNLGTPQSSVDVGCGDIQPEYGITGTPVIVRNNANSGTIYVVSATEPSSMSFHTQIHALSLSNGADRQSPVEIAPSAVLTNGSTITFDPQNQMERTGLLWANKSVYVGFGSHCDNALTSITGWLLRYSPSLQLLNKFNTVDDSADIKLGSIWMGGYPSAADTSGNVYFSTGNGAYDANTGGRNYGESIVKLSPSLSVESEFTPADWQTWNTNDTDEGSGAVMLIPNTNDLITMGKPAQLFVLNESSLGGESSGNSGALQFYQDTGNPDGVWGGPAYYQGPSATYVYYQLDNSPLQQFTFNGNSVTLTGTGTSNAGYGGSSPVVSSNGQTAGTGVVWVAKRGSSVTLEAYDASNVSHLLFSAFAGNWNNTANNPFVTPLEANGRVYVGSAGNVAVFGLAPLATPKAPTNFVPGGMGTQLHVHGFIQGVQGASLTLKRRGGTLVTVDISTALQRQRTGVLAPNIAVILWGTLGADHVFHVMSISHTSSNPADWGSDSF